MTGRAIAAALAAALIAITFGGCGATPRAGSGAYGEDHTEAYLAFLRAELEASEAHWQEAADALDDAVRGDPTAWELRVRRAIALRHIGEYADAHRELAAAERLDAPSDDLAIARAELLAAEDCRAEAYDLLATGAASGSAERFAVWVELARRDNAPDETLRAASQWVEAHDSAAAWRALGAAHEAAEGWLDAASAYGEASRRPNPRPEDAVRQVDLLIRGEAPAEAAAQADDCVARFPEMIACWVRRATLSDADAAEDDPVSAETAAALEDLAARASGGRRSLAYSWRALAADARPRLLATYAATSASLRPYNVAVLSAAAWMAASADRERLAVAMMKRVLIVDPTNFDALNYVGYTWAELGTQLAEAEAYVNRALELRPGDANMIDSLAWVYYRQGRFEEALELQRVAVEGIDDNAVLWDHLGDIYAALGRAAEALDAWQRALELADEYDEDVLETVPAKIEALP